MTTHILLIQTDAQLAETLSSYFDQRGDFTHVFTSAVKVEDWLVKNKPDLIFIDLHLETTELGNILKKTRMFMPETHIIATNRFPDLQKEIIAKEYGVEVFLRPPYTRQWIEKAIQKTNLTIPNKEAQIAGLKLPNVRISMRTKITFPFVLLAIVFTVAFALLISRYVFESVQERFVNQLIDTGYQAADAMVDEENRLLETLRLLANTEGVAKATSSGDSQSLITISLPVAINYQEDSIHFLNISGVSILSLQKVVNGMVEDYNSSYGSLALQNESFVQQVLRGEQDRLGDKYAAYMNTPDGNYFFVSGPIFDETNTLVGVVVIGTSLEKLTQTIAGKVFSQVTLYDIQGTPMASTLSRVRLSAVDQVVRVSVANKSAELRTIDDTNNPYTELINTWQARSGVPLGFIGVALQQNYIINPTSFTRFQSFLLVGLVFVSIFLLGITLARQVTHPLDEVVNASSEVANGNLDVRVPSGGNDELAVVGQAFNYMVSGLQEGVIYRDLLGRTVSPEVRDTLREAFASGDLHLEGQTSTATVMMTDIRGFTTLSEKVEPTTVLAWLNEYFGRLVPIITAYGGVLDKYEGDAMLAFFGILPRPVPPEESAYTACKAAIEMLAEINAINDSRSARGEMPLITGIAVNTGYLTAGALGAADRMNYTIIGDTVNTTQRMEGTTREFGETGIVISESTLMAIKGHWNEFRMQTLGEFNFKGKSDKTNIYRLFPVQTQTSNEE